MTVQELIDKLIIVENKNQRVVINCIGKRRVYDANNVRSASFPKNETSSEYEKGIVITNV